MQLKIQRSQRMGGMMGSTVLFCLDVRADYSAEEAANIAKYKLGREVIYSSQAAARHIENARGQLAQGQSGSFRESAAGLAKGVASIALSKLHLTITIASLGKGQHIECKDLRELREAEETVLQACRELRDYLNVAASFNGSVVLVDFTDGEKVHVADGAQALAALQGSGAAAIGISFQEAVFEEVPDGVGPSPSAAPGGLGADDVQALFGSFGNDMREQYARTPGAFWMGGSVVASILTWMLGGFVMPAVLVLAAGLIAYFLMVRPRQHG
jgi:hypothetical protein